MKEFLKKVKQAVSGRLLILRKKINKETLRKQVSLVRVRLEILRLRLQMKLKQGKGWLLDRTARIRQTLNRETLHQYYRKALLWAKTNLNQEALKGYARSAICWLRKLPSYLTWENIRKWALAGWAYLCIMPEKLRRLRKNALAASCLLLALWLFMGTATSMAWLTDTTEVKRNSFEIGEMNLKVEYRRPDMADFAEMTADSKIFNDAALYEPGYTQVVYLHIENDGNVEFDYEIKVRDFEYGDSVSVNGTPLHLPDYLKFGLVTAATEPELERKTAQAIADKEMERYCHDLGEYSQRGKTLDKDDEEYAALIVFMPEQTGNEANYRRGEDAPWVSLGITVYAQQAGTMDLE